MNELMLFNPIKTELSLVLPNLKTITVVESEQAALVVSLGLKSLTGMLSAAEGLRKTTKQPFLDKGKMVDEHHKKMVAEALEVQAQLKRVLINWNAVLTKKKEEERKRLEDEKRVADEKRVLEMSRDVTPADDDFDALLKSDVQVQRETVIKAANIEVEQFVADKTHESNLKQIDSQKVKGIRKVWTFEVTDEDQLPRKFLMADEQHIRKAVAEGIRDIPGVRIWEDERMASR